MRRSFLVALVVLLGMATMPIASSHNATVAHEQYIRFLNDCSDDWGGHSALRDGHDLVALDMTERWMPEAKEPGFFVLLTVGFGFAESGSQGGPLRDDIELTGPDGPIRIRLVTSDNSVFTAERATGFQVPDVILPVRPSLLQNGAQDGSRIMIEFGFRYSSLGLDPGDKITAAKVQAYARQDRGDYMPGGNYVLGAANPPNIDECPPSGHSGGGDVGSRYVRKDYELGGVESTYMQLSLDTDALAVSGNESATLSASVRNAFRVSASQEFRVTPVAPAGWQATVVGPSTMSAEPERTVVFPIEVKASTGVAENGTLRIVVDSPVGGHGEREVPIYWYPPGVEASVPPTTSAGESSAAGFVLVLAFAVATVAITHRRR